MKMTCISILMIVLFALPTNAQQKSDTPEASKPAGQAKSKPTEDEERYKLTKLALLTDDELNQLLDRRLKGGLGTTFGDYNKMFLVQSRLSVGTGIGLLTDDRKIMRTELQPAFPESYHPTLRELLDAISLQTFSEWKYDREKQFVQSDTVQEKPVEGLVNFHFQRAKRKKPFSVKIAEGWKMEDKGHWVMYIPPEFPVGMDIYEFGRYSTKQNDKKTFFDRIRSDIALEWAQRVSPEASADELKPAKVGKYEALFYDKLLKGNGRKLHWRQWVFMVEDRCFFVASTMPPNLEGEIFPDIEEMIQSFKMEE